MKSTFLSASLFCMVLFSLLLCSCKTEPKVPTTEDKIATVTSRLRADPDKLHPALTTFGSSIQVLRLIYSTLLEFDPWTLELEPVLAKSRPQLLTIEEGPHAGKSAYAYSIHESAIWVDGSPVTGHDYAFTLKTLFNPHVPAAAYRGLLNFIDDVEVDAQNPKNFRVILGKSFIKAEYNTGGFFIIPKTLLDKDGLMDHVPVKELLDAEKAKELAETDEKLKMFAELINDPKYSREPAYISGCGAYQLEEWVTGDRVVLKKKKDWWGDALAAQYPMLTARPDVITFKPIPDAATAVNLLKDESLDVLYQLPNSKFLELQKNELVTANYNLHNPPTTIYNFIALNTRSPKLNDKRVRRALAHLLDLDQVIKTAKYGMAQPIASPIPPMSKDYNKQLQPIPLDINKAKQLLEEAGWKDTNGNGTVDKRLNGQLTEMNLNYLITPNNEISNTIALIFKENAKKAGVNIEVDIKENSLIIQLRKKRDFEMMARGAAPDLVYYDPYQYWHTASDNPSGSNYSGFGNAESDALIEEIRATLDEQKRRQLYYRFQEIVYDEQPAIFVYNSQDCVVLHKRLSHAKPSVNYPGIFENFYGNE